MRVLFAVLDDLFRFALKSLFGFVPFSEKFATIGALPQPLQPLLPLLPLLPEFKITAPSEIVNVHGSYFVSTPATQVRTDPVATFDNVTLELPYGEQITVLKYGGRWAMVQAKEDTIGWVLKDCISSAAVDVFPTFASGSAYDSHDETTKKLRLLIKDMFTCTEPTLPLTAAEYVTYRLWRTQRRIDWSRERPRLPGRWQSLLRGRPGIHIGVIPKTGSVMEWLENDMGNLAYVEAVFPDNSIQISAVDQEGLGVYSESVLALDVWRELHPIFIEVQ